MKLATSYFYQIRNFPKNYIPVSTAIWDPAWYHNCTGDYSHLFYDRRGILNGLRCETIIEQGRHSNHGPEICPCEDKDYNTCSFLRNYRENLNNIDFDTLYKDFEDLAKLYQEKENIKEEITIVLIVYEAPNNPCSERKPLQEYFKAHGIECNELEYPIQKLDLIKDEPFDF